MLSEDAAHQILVGGPLASSEWTDLVERLLPTALRRLSARGLAPARCEVSVVLVNEDEIQALNRQYRGIDAATDVLSFSQLEGPHPEYGTFPPEYLVPLGDIVLSTPRMLAQALEYGHSAEREFGFLLVHGLLHLLGYDHEAPADARAMRAAEEDVLAAAGLTKE